MKLHALIRVLVADPHPVVCEGLAALLSRQSDMEIVGEVYQGKEVLDRFSELRPDVLVMEVHFPDVDGISLVASIRTRFPSANILILSSRDGDETVYQALRAGAKGYFVKDAATDAIVEAIRSVYQGQSILTRHIASVLAMRVQTLELTPREQRILLHMVQGQSNQQIGTALFIAEGTVKAHISNILRKLGVSDRTQAVVVAIRRGLISHPW